MSKRDLFVFLFKWKASLLGVFLLVMLAASAIVFLAPPSYSATSKVLVERNRPPVLRTTLGPAMDLAEALNTEAEILLSRTVMTHVVDKLKPQDRPRQPGRLSSLVDASKAWMEEQGLLYAQPPRERWIQQLQKNVKVKPSIDSSILKINYSDDNPQWAARIVNAVIDEYIAQHVRVFSARGSSQVYQERMQAIEADLTRRRAEMAAQKQRLSLAAVEDTKRDLVRRIGDFGGQKQTARDEIDSLLQRFERGHHEVEVATAKLARIERAEAQAREQLGRLEAQSARLDDLQLEIGALETAYRDYARRYDDARFADMASANAINVGAVDYADVPVRPENSRLFLLVVAAGGALLLSLLVATVREYFDRRLSNPQAAEDILGLPDLGSVPVLRRADRQALHGAAAPR
ncbi:MAG: hypothetical protein IIZ92_24945 [Aquincola sp.]|nr:hypothetical protein [Aquincola sp.]